MHTREAFAHGWITDPKGRPWTPRAYQRKSLESWAERKVHCDGRDVGKTAEIEIVAAWAAATRPGSEMLVATQCENHLYPLMERIARRFEMTSAFAAGLELIKRTPSWQLRFQNGFVLWGRIAGPRGVNFQGLHVDWQIVDEAQELTETAWAELYQALNAGGRRWVYGVPNGLRNTFYRITQDPTAEQYNWPSTLHPDYTAEKDAELARLYGGRNAPGYIHRVLGEHGAPLHAVFDLDDYNACVHDGVDFHDLDIGADDSFAMPAQLAAGDYYLGADLGYAHDPSEFVLYRNDAPHLVNVLRVHLHGVHYDRQLDVIQEIDRACDGCRAIALDAGNAGRALAHQLKALSPEWCARVHAVEFGGVTELEPLPDDTPDRRPTKEFMTQLLQQRMRDRTIVFPRLADREMQYASHTFAYGAEGRIRYEKGNDHLVDADRCALLGHYLANHAAGESIVPLSPRLHTFRW